MTRKTPPGFKASKKALFSVATSAGPMKRSCKVMVVQRRPQQVELFRRAKRRDRIEQHGYVGIAGIARHRFNSGDLRGRAIGELLGWNEMHRPGRSARR